MLRSFTVPVACLLMGLPTCVHAQSEGAASGEANTRIESGGHFAFGPDIAFNDLQSAGGLFLRFGNDFYITEPSGNGGRWGLAMTWFSTNAHFGSDDVGLDLQMLGPGVVYAIPRQSSSLEFRYGLRPTIGAVVSDELDDESYHWGFTHTLYGGFRRNMLQLGLELQVGSVHHVKNFDDSEGYDSGVQRSLAALRIVLGLHF